MPSPPEALEGPQRREGSEAPATGVATPLATLDGGKKQQPADVLGKDSTQHKELGSRVEQSQTGTGDQVVNRENEGRKDEKEKDKRTREDKDKKEKKDKREDKDKKEKKDKQEDKGKKKKKDKKEKKDKAKKSKKEKKENKVKTAGKPGKRKRDDPASSSCKKVKDLVQLSTSRLVLSREQQLKLRAKATAGPVAKAKAKGRAAAVKSAPKTKAKAKASETSEAKQGINWVQMSKDADVMEARKLTVEDIKAKTTGSASSNAVADRAGGSTAVAARAGGSSAGARLKDKVWQDIHEKDWTKPLAEAFYPKS